MLVKKPIISRIIIGLFLIMLTCWLPASGADNVSVTPVTTPFITIDPIGNHTVGDVFFINGTTNLRISEDQKLQISISPRSSNPRGLNVNLFDPTVISESNGYTHWSFNLTDIDWQSKEYVATVFSPKNPSAYSAQSFTFFPVTTLTIPSLVQEQPSSQFSSLTQTTYPQTKTIPSAASPFPPILAIFMIGIVIIHDYYRNR